MTTQYPLAVLILALLSAAVACGGRNEAEPGDSTVLEQVDGVPSVATEWKTDWSKSTIELAELVVGIGRAGDSRDVIPPLDDPAFESVADASEWLNDREPVVLLDLNGDIRAYPLQILTWHEIVNDVVDGTPVAVTYCPLCNSAVAFDRRVGERTLRFGVSGLLRNSDLVMWDDVTESLWQQITGEAIVGELTGTHLDLIAAPVIRWADLRSRFPQATVLSRKTGYQRAYGSNPYEGYDGELRPFLFSGELDDRYPAMERVVGVTVDGTNKAYPFSVLEREFVINDKVSGVPVVVAWGAPDTASALDAAGIADGRGVGVGIAYERKIDGETLTFEAVGEDRFRDRETDTVWDILGKAIKGPLAGRTLTPVIQTNHLWFAWAAFNAGSEVYTGAD